MAEPVGWRSSEPLGLREPELPDCTSGMPDGEVCEGVEGTATGGLVLLWKIRKTPISTIATVATIKSLFFSLDALFSNTGLTASAGNTCLFCFFLFRFDLPI